MVAADLVIPYLTQRVIDHGIVEKDLSVVLATAFAMVGASILSMIFALINNYISVSVAMGFAADLRSALMRRVQSFSFGNLDRLQTGKLIVRSTSDVNMVHMIVLLSLRILTRAPIWAVGAIVLLILTSVRLALIMVVFMPLVVILVWWVSKKAHVMFQAMQDRLDRLNTVLQENLAGVRVVKAFVRAVHEMSRFGKANDALMDQTVRASQLMAIFMPLMLLVLNLAVVAAVWVGGITAMAGDLTVGEVVASINYLMFALFPIFMLGGMIGPLAAAEASAGRILEVLEAEPQVASAGRKLKLSDPRGRIVFEKVSFSYPGNGSEPVLTNVSFAAEPGETVAILGATGCGKSTLIHLIPRFYDVTAGRITLDGTDIRDLDLAFLRGAIGVVLQEAVLFSGSVRDNIRYGRKDATDEEVVAAARAAQADEFITGLPAGYDTEIGQRGVTLSGGQRQRLSIARALLISPKVLILDDATSALDVETEIRLQDALDRLIAASKNATTRFIVAQRISTVLLADKILLLDQGRIAAVGTHRQLLETSTMYQDIYNSQLGGPVTEKGGQHG